MRRHQNRGLNAGPGMSLADPRIAGQAVPGGQVARAWSAAWVRKHGKARADTAPAAWRGERERVKRREP